MPEATGVTNGVSNQERHTSGDPEKEAGSVITSFGGIRETHSASGESWNSLRVEHFRLEGRMRGSKSFNH
jgi:hypothetical protein